MFARVLLSIFILTACLFAEETYDIRLARPMKAGDRFDVVVKMALDDSMVTSFDGKDVEEDKTSAACRLTGELKIVAVTSKGQPMEVRLKLKTVECIEDGQPSEFFKAGDELHLKKEDPDNVAEVNGEPAEDIQAQVIESILNVEAEGEVSDDDVFGTKEKVKVGAEWRTFGLGFAQFGSSPGNFSFTRSMTQGPDPRVAGNGDGLASFLLGTGTGGQATHRIKPADLSRYYAVYAQDDYKVNSKLTLNVG